jgi:hypothetical protein
LVYVDIAKVGPEMPDHVSSQQGRNRVTELPARALSIFIQWIPVWKELKARHLTETQMAICPVEGTIVRNPLRGHRRRWRIGIQLEKK